MHYDVSYAKDNSPRRAVFDLVHWIGFRRARIMLKIAKYGMRSANGEIKTDIKTRWDAFNFYCSMLGVSGHPVREAFKRWASITQAQLEAIPD